MIIQLKDQITTEESVKIASEIQAFHIVAVVALDCSSINRVTTDVA